MAGFTMFYMGVNLGASLSPLICGLRRLKAWLALRIWPGDDRHDDRSGNLRNAYNAYSSF